MIYNQKLQCLQLALVNRKGPILLHHNIRIHVAQPMLQRLNELGCEVLPHPPYSRDLLPTHGQRSLAGYSPWGHKERHDWGTFTSLHFTHQQTTTSSISTTYLQRKYFHNQQDAENAFQELVESQSTDFYATGINKLSSHWQKCVACTGSYFFLSIKMCLSLLIMI